MRNNNQKFTAGYIALTSAIIMSALILTIVLAVSLRGYSTRLNIAETYYKEISLFVAEACVHEAILSHKEDSLYNGDETIDVGEETCTIEPFEDTGDIPPNKIIKTSSTVVEATTRLKVVYDTINTAIVSWEEVESF